MTKIYTKTGDKGQTGLLGGTRLYKSHVRIASYGEVDELNSHIGLLRDQPVNQTIADQLIVIQNKLFVIGSHLASDPEKSKVKIPSFENTEIVQLEKWIDEMDLQLPEMKFFVLPGGHSSVSYGHIARTVCRRAERTVVLLSTSEKVEEDIIVYLNRLSDYLFVLCRWMTHQLGIEEVPWKP